MLEANKQQVSRKSYSLKVKIDSVNQILRSKGKVKPVTYIYWQELQTRRFHASIHVFRIKYRGPGPSNSLCHTNHRKHFLGLTPAQNRMEAHMFHLAREVEKI